MTGGTIPDHDCPIYARGFATAACIQVDGRGVLAQGRHAGLGRIYLDNRSATAASSLAL